MATFQHSVNINAGISPHDVLVGMGLEVADHSTGQLCSLTSMGSSAITLDDATVFETGQPAGQLSAARQALLLSGLWRGGADVTTLRQYLALAAGNATAAQTQAALQALIRVVRTIANS